MTNKVLLECLYRGIRTETRSIIEQRLSGGILLHPYEVVAQTLDNIAITYERNEETTSGIHLYLK